MDKIKQVFSHDKSSSSHSTHDSASNAAARNSTGFTETPTSSSAGDRTSAAVTDEAPRTDIATGDRSAVGSNADRTGATTGLTDTKVGSTSGTGVAETSVERGAEHIREHAHPPGHHHNQPRTDGLLDEAGAKKATHDHQHLAPVTHEKHHHHEVEEVERQREIDRHVHHVQHHVQPVVDEQHATETQHEKAVPVTEVRERHVATEEDKAQFAALNTGRDTVAEAPREKTIIDRGEQVRENTHHHVHHVVQPEIERDVHEHHRIHTVIPVHQKVEEAPIIHESVQHEPLRIDEFTKNGGDLSSTLKHDANLLDRGECERTVDGPAESLTQNLGLGNSSIPSGSANQTTRI